MKILLVYYHPVIFDLAESFQKLFDGKVEVTIAVNPTLKDSYGDSSEVMEKVATNAHLSDVDCIYTPQALRGIAVKEFDLVGCDGVFDGDELIMDMCRGKDVPFFNINGYPHQCDEPAKNILAFSWHLPQAQYKKAFPHEGYVKEKDWRHIAEHGRSEGKNICVFYPEMSEAKRFSENASTDDIKNRFVSFIHRYKECNRWNHSVFDQVKALIPSVENYTGLSQNQVFRLLAESRGLLHLKHADCPGIAVLESLILGAPIFTMESFVKASFNQEVLIDGFNSVVASSLEELVRRMISCGYETFDYVEISKHAYMLTSLDRQKYKLEQFIERSISEK